MQVGRRLIVLGLRSFAGCCEERGDQFANEVAVYHRKSGARLLWLPVSAGVRTGLVSLGANLDFFYCVEDVDLRCWLLSRRLTSKEACVPLTKAVNRHLDLVRLACLKKGSLLSLHAKWESLFD